MGGGGMKRQLVVTQLRSVPAVMKALDRLELDIQQTRTLEALNVITDVIRGIRQRWKPVTAVADRAGELWIEAEAKIGEEHAKIGPAKGTRGTLRGKPKGSGSSGRAILVTPDKDAPSRKELGLGKRQLGRGRKLFTFGKRKRQSLIMELKADGKPVAPQTALALDRSHAKIEKQHAIAAAAFSETGPFDVVVIDPPWPMQKIDREVRPNQDAFDYGVMTEAELAEFWPKEIADKLSPDCHVFIWTTQRFLPMTLRLLEPWDLSYVLVMVWHKAGGFQPIGLPQFNCEFIVYARKGAPIFVDTTNFFCCFEAPRREHSRKPDFFYELIRRVTGGSRIDVFARERHEGFSQYGNETAKFEAAE
jgi:N6-adenosine-specific RNA methylase IME4